MVLESWFLKNLVGLLGVVGGLTIAAVAVWKAKTERRIERTTVRGQRAIDALKLLYDAIAIVDSHDRIIEVNQQFRFITGYNEDELLGMHVNALLPPELRDQHVKHMKHYHDSPYPRLMGKSGMKLYLLDKSGNKKRVQISLRPKEGTSNGPEVILCVRVIDDVVGAVDA